MNYPSTQSHDPAPSEFYLPVTPSDTIKLPAGTCRGIYIGVQGDVTVISPLDGTTAITFVAASGILPIRTNQIKATGTTATNLIALY